MKCVVQRVSSASVSVNEKIVGRIEKGLLVLVGFTHTDTEKEVLWMAKKIANMRIFSDEEGNMNLSVKDTSGGVLVVSQFTLYADAKKGTRPSFVHAMEPTQAEKLYEYFIEELRKEKIPVETGIFGAKMSVSLINEGPVTILVHRVANLELKSH